MKSTVIRTNGKITEHATVADAYRVMIEEFGICEVASRKCSREEIAARGSLALITVKGKIVATLMIH